MAKKKAKAHMMGKYVRVFEIHKGCAGDKVLKQFVAGSRGMPENMARWAAKNNIEVINLRRDKRDGRLRVWL
jgi:hypothetical protein